MKKIPDNAKKVFEGLIFDVYHWDQEMFDGSIAIFEAIKKREAVFVVAVSDNKILLNSEEQPVRGHFLSLPGGMCDKESIDSLVDIKRELSEETGYNSENWQHWFTSDLFNHVKLVWNNNFYIAKNCIKVIDAHVDAGEKIETKLITFEEFLELRNNSLFRNKEIIPLLEKAANSEEEKQTLKDLLGITT